MATAKFKAMPQKAECSVSGQRPQPVTPSAWPVDSVAMTARMPTRRPQVMPARVNQDT